MGHLLMKTLSVDVAVIGADAAGMTAYRAAQTHGKHVVLIEGGNYRTTCAEVGCNESVAMSSVALGAVGFIDFFRWRREFGSEETDRKYKQIIDYLAAGAADVLPGCSESQALCISGGSE